MNCCKSNKAVIVTPREQPPEAAQIKSNKSSIKEQASRNTEKSSIESDVGVFLSGTSTSLKEGKPYSNEDSLEKGVERAEEEKEKQQRLESVNSNLPGSIEDCSTDDISTVYEEPPKVPKDAFVLLPNAAQRGYEKGSFIEYGSKDEWIQTRPYRIGTLVLFRDDDSRYGKFKLYIPGVVEDHVFSKTDKNEVIGYKIQIEASAIPKMEQCILDLLRNAPPEHVMLRWDEKVPPCPAKNIGMKASEKDTQDRITKLVEEYGEDLGFQGAKQNGQR